MPFKSEAQRRWMYANNPKLAKKFEAETPRGKKLPEYVKKKKKKKTVKKEFIERLDYALGICESNKDEDQNTDDHTTEEILEKDVIEDG